MPEFRPPADITKESGEGWQLALLADGAHVPGMPMAAWRWTVEPGRSTPNRSRGEAEAFLYVIAGGGRVEVAGDVFPLAREDVVWLEGGDAYRLHAGEAGLQVLEAAATS